jgi:hypothetical protein
VRPSEQGMSQTARDTPALERGRRYTYAPFRAAVRCRLLTPLLLLLLGAFKTAVFLKADQPATAFAPRTKRSFLLPSRRERMTLLRRAGVIDTGG